jgi:hypothetical protein
VKKNGDPTEWVRNGFAWLDEQSREAGAKVRFAVSASRPDSSLAIGCWAPLRVAMGWANASAFATTVAVKTFFDRTPSVFTEVTRGYVRMRMSAGAIVELYVELKPADRELVAVR